MSNVWVLNITHRGGSDVFVCATEEQARWQLYRWARDWWKKEMGNDRIPANVEKTVDLYFQRVNETYYIFETEVIGS